MSSPSPEQPGSRYHSPVKTTLRTQLLRVCPLLLCLTGLIGCVQQGQSGSSGVGPDGMTCRQRLIGAWRYTGFAPYSPLPPANQQAIESLHRSIRLTFDGQVARTTGNNVNATNPYNVTADDGMNCKVIATDPNGVPSESAIRFVDPNHIEVNDTQSSNPGRATLERTQ